MARWKIIDISPLEMEPVLGCRMYTEPFQCYIITLETENGKIGKRFCSFVLQEEMTIKELCSVMEKHNLILKEGVPK